MPVQLDPRTSFTLLTHDLAVAIEPWFDDADTTRHLGGREWVHQVLHLMSVMPGFVDGDITVLDRRAWVVEDDGRHVALIDVEVYNDRTASLAIVVNPDQRGCGVAQRVLVAIWDLPELANVDELFGSIDVGNEASRRCLLAAGFMVASEPDHQGMLRVEMKRHHAPAKVVTRHDR